LNQDVAGTSTLRDWRGGDTFVIAAMGASSLVANFTVARAYGSFPNGGTAWTTLLNSGNGARHRLLFRW
jgi:hypothetical protein